MFKPLKALVKSKFTAPFRAPLAMPAKVPTKASRLAAYKSDTSGNIAIITAFSLFAFMGCLAISVDLSQGYFAKQRLQNTTDAIALMAAKDGLESNSDLTAAAQAYFAQLYPGADGSRIELINIARDGDTVTIEARNQIDTNFAPVLGRDAIDVRVASTATYANKAMDLALVLDTTYSMTGAKMASLKSAANGLVDTIDDERNDNVRMSVIPFSQYVNVGLSRRNAVWLDVPADETRTRMRREVVSRTNCRNERRTGSNDGVPVSWTARVCDTVYGPPRPVTSTVTWEGCVGSRSRPYHLEAEYNGRRIPGLLGVRCGTEIRELTTDMSQVKSTISRLTANGETYMPAGLLWGWRALDNQQPLQHANMNGVQDTKKVLVLMTDGENTKSKNGLYHNGGSETQADDTTERLCDNIKDEEITVFTIAYDVSDSATKDLISDCATDRSKFFDARNASELNKAFQDIGASLSELRITS